MVLHSNSCRNWCVSMNISVSTCIDMTPLSINLIVLKKKSFLSWIMCIICIFYCIIKRNDTYETFIIFQKYIRNIHGRLQFHAVLTSLWMKKKNRNPLEIVNFPVSCIWFFISHERMTLYSAIIFIDVSK